MGGLHALKETYRRPTCLKELRRPIRNLGISVSNRFVIRLVSHPYVSKSLQKSPKFVICPNTPFFEKYSYDNWLTWGWYIILMHTPWIKVLVSAFQKNWIVPRWPLCTSFHLLNLSKTCRTHEKLGLKSEYFYSFIFWASNCWFFKKRLLRALQF